MASKILFALTIFGVAILHFIATFMLTFITGTTEGGNGPLVVLNRVLTFPLSVLDNNAGGDDASPILMWGLWFGTSLVWGAAICFGVRALLGRK